MRWIVLTDNPPDGCLRLMGIDPNAKDDKFTLEIKNLSVKVAKVQNHMVEVAIVTKKEEKLEETAGEE